MNWRPDILTISFKLTVDIIVVTATYDFDGVEAKHMSFKSGAQIEVLEKNDDWWHGRIQGTSTQGWFPSNRATPPKGPIKTTKKAPPPPGAAKKEAARPAPVPQASPPAGEPIKAIYDFEGQQDSDLR